MQSLFQPVVNDIVGLVSQQVEAAKAKEKAALDVSNSLREFLSVCL